MTDCNYETQNDVYVFEFKLDGLAEVVLQQIESEAMQRNMPQILAKYTRQVLTSLRRQDIQMRGKRNK